MAQLGRGYPYLRRRDLVAWGSPWGNIPHRWAIDPGIITGSEGLLYFTGTRFSEVGVMTNSAARCLWQFRPNPGTPVLLRINLWWNVTNNLNQATADVGIQRFGVQDIHLGFVSSPGNFGLWNNAFTLRIPLGLGTQLQLNPGDFRAATYAECQALGDVPYG